jgi:phosphoketolase
VSIAQVAEPASTTELDPMEINTIRTLSMDAVERAKSGHPEHPWRCRNYAHEHGIDDPEVARWRWPY